MRPRCHSSLVFSRRLFVVSTLCCFSMASSHRHDSSHIGSPGNNTEPVATEASRLSVYHGPLSVVKVTTVDIPFVFEGYSFADWLSASV